jgi:hypothetical protein
VSAVKIEGLAINNVSFKTETLIYSFLKKSDFLSPKTVSLHPDRTVGILTHSKEIPAQLSGLKRPPFFT